MLLAEWNIDDAKEVWQEEAWEDGWEKGIEKGMERGIEKGMERGMEKGIEKGREEGQKNILELVRQGYTAEQIEMMLASRSSNSVCL
ncbi:MAG: hypothetical protein LBQ38_11965 [Spirochaetaceae bacterium]|jgi:flagellar biosynthesis/type III secretory pathway protein FliH|nr:hypothetical protein [Spirochaetaceae bacterium]